jgi:hypothetical protein
LVVNHYHPLWRRAVVAWAVPVLLTLLATTVACSNGSDGPGIATAIGATATPSPTVSLSAADRMRQFAQCMREHGIDVGDPSGNQGRVELRAVDKSRANAALRACQSLLPGGSLSGPLTQEQSDQMRHFTQCLRDHGLDVADPDPNGGGILISPGPGVSRTDPRVQDALSACQNLMPGASSGGKPGGGA